MKIVPENAPQKNLPVEKLTIAERVSKLLRDRENKTIEELLKILPGKDDMTLEDVFTAVYCVVSDFLDHIGGQTMLRTSNNNNPDFTDAEVATIALVETLAQQDSQNAWHKFVRKNYLHLFPRLCSRSRYTRRVFFLQDIICLFQRHLCGLLCASNSPYLIVDSFPLELCNMRRLSSSSQPFEYHGANFGYCAAKKLYYYGFKCHIVSDLRGVPIFVHLTSASMSDLYAFESVVEHMVKLNIVTSPAIYVADRGYVGEEFQQHIQAQYGVTLFSMEREYLKDIYGASPKNEFLKQVRKIVETTIDLFSKELHAGRTRRRSISGLASSLLTKLSAFNLANLFNSLLNLPLLRIKGFVF